MRVTPPSPSPAPPPEARTRLVASRSSGRWMPTRRPWLMMPTRSLIDRSSSSSEEIRITPLPAAVRPIDQAIDRDARADVDPLRRLVEDEEIGIGEEPAGDDDLLLIAAGEDSRPPWFPQPGVISSSRTSFRPSSRSRVRLIRPCRPSRPSAAMEMFGITGEIEEQAVGFPVLRNERNARRDGLLGIPEADRACPSARSSPSTIGSTPKSARASSVRPDPSTPPMPKTSPR